MKRILFAALLGLSGIAAQASNVGVSVSIGQPGFYGRIDLGNVGQPQTVYREPVWVGRGPVRGEPIYLRVPPGHERNWRGNCQRYGACGQPVYFVHDDWYRNTYVPHYRDYYRDNRWNDRPRDRDHDGVPDYRDRDHGHGNDRPRDRDRDGVPDYRDRDNGRGHDNKGHGRGRD